jgi:hypothetical protein
MLCVMTLTSAGYTAIVGYCSMTHESKCCCEESCEKNDAPSPGMSITDQAAPCFTRTVAGGLNEITATTLSDVTAHPVVLEVIPVDSYAIGHASQTHSFLTLAVEVAAPPGVDIYIRVNSFLI